MKKKTKKDIEDLRVEELRLILFNYVKKYGRPLYPDDTQDDTYNMTLKNLYIVANTYGTNFIGATNKKVTGDYTGFDTHIKI